MHVAHAYFNYTPFLKGLEETFKILSIVIRLCSNTNFLIHTHLFFCA